MALTLRSSHLAKQLTLPESRKPKIQAALKALFSYLAQHAGDPDLQVVPIDTLDGTASVIADAACRLRALYLKKPIGSTTASFIKLTDDDVTASATAGALTIELPSNQEEILVFADGLPFSDGIVAISNTAAAGSTASGAPDQASGFAIISAP